jgi:hypothetical protein
VGSFTPSSLIFQINSALHIETKKNMLFSAGYNTATRRDTMSLNPYTFLDCWLELRERWLKPARAAYDALRAMDRAIESSAAASRG